MKIRISMSSVFSLIFFLCLDLIPANGYAQALSLDDCVKAAIKNSHAVKIKQNQLQIQDNEIKISKTSRLPVLSLNSQYSYTSETMELNLPLPGLVTPPDIKFGDGNKYDLSLQASTLLYSGGSIKNRIQADKLELKGREFDLQAEILSLSNQVRKAYIQVLLSREKCKTVQLSLSRLNRQLDIVDNLLENGMSSQLDRLLLVKNITEVQQLLLEAENQKKNALYNLENLTGKDLKNTVLKNEIYCSLLGDTNHSSVLNRPELNALDIRTEKLEKIKSVQQSKYLPSLSAMASYNYGKPGIDMVSNEWMDYAIVGLTLNWTIWDNKQRSYRVQNAKKQIEIIVKEKEDLKKNLDWTLKVQQSNLENNFALFELANDLYSQQQEINDMINNQMMNANATMNDLLDAEDNLRIAEINKIMAALNCRLTEIEILYLTGK